MEAALQQSKPEMPRDADSDFAEINPLDDIDVSDQLVKKKEVCLFICITRDTVTRFFFFNGINVWRLFKTIFKTCLNRTLNVT